MKPIIEIRQLKKSFGEVQAVKGVDLSISTGICQGLLGPNGAGKSTTVEMMEGIKTPDAGEILYKGEPIGAAFRQQAGIMFQSTALQDFITVYETLKMFERFYERTTPLEDLIETFALGPILKRDTRKLSGGQKQRVLLAIALINDPELVFLDEPSTGLDPQARRNIWEMIQDIRSRGKTVILTTHYMDEAYELCDNIAIMDQGQIIAQGSPDDLLAAHFDDVVIQLPLADVAHLKAVLPGITFTVRDQMQLIVSDVDATLKQLVALNVPLRGLRIRSRNLEDLFIELTGKELRS